MHVGPATVGANEPKDPGQNYLYIRLPLCGCRCVAIVGNSPAIAHNRALLQPQKGTLGVDEIILTRALTTSKACHEQRRSRN